MKLNLYNSFWKSKRTNEKDQVPIDTYNLAFALMGRWAYNFELKHHLIDLMFVCVGGGVEED